MSALGKCPRCGAAYLRIDECPALCAPAPVPPPVYTGPATIGKTHLGRLAQPVFMTPRDEGWVG